MIPEMKSGYSVRCAEGRNAHGSRPAPEGYGDGRAAECIVDTLVKCFVR